METKIKGIIATAGAIISAKLGVLSYILPLLMVVMIADYCTGMLAAKKQGTTNSRTGMWGIVKKTMYGVEVAVAMVVDWTIINVASNLGISIPTTTFFGLLVSIWLIINELISILENLTKLETPMPAFLVKVVQNFKIVVENSGDELADKVEKVSKEEIK